MKPTKTWQTSPSKEWTYNNYCLNSNQIAAWAMRQCANIVTHNAQVQDLPPKYTEFMILESLPEVIREMAPYVPNQPEIAVLLNLYPM